MKSYLFNIGLALTRALNTILAGSPDETTSSRAYRAKVKGHKYWKWTASFIDTLFFWDSEHCKNAHLNDLKRAKGNLKVWQEVKE